MKRLVLDASLATHALTEAQDHPLLWRKLASRALHAPHLIDFEVANTLRGLTLGGKLSRQMAATTLADFGQLRIIRHPGSALVDRIWELRDNFNAYDAAYVALAELLECPLFTGDAKLDNGVHRAQVQVYPGLV